MDKIKKAFFFNVLTLHWSNKFKTLKSRRMNATKIPGVSIGLMCNTVPIKAKTKVTVLLISPQMLISTEKSIKRHKNPLCIVVE